MADNFPLAVTPTVTGLQKFVQDNKEVQKTLDGTRAVADKTRGATRSSVFRTRNTTFAFQQLAFGVEDFTSVLGTQGLAGGLRAAGNNISQFASLISPLGGILAGLGVAAGAVALQFSGGPSDPFSAMKESAEQAKKNTESLVDNVNKQLQNVFSKNVLEKFTSDQFRDFEFGEKLIANAMDAIDRQGSRAAQQIQTLTDKITIFREEAEFLEQRSRSGDPTIAAGAQTRLSSVRARISALSDELAKLKALERGSDGITGRMESRDKARSALEELRTKLREEQAGLQQDFKDALIERTQKAKDRDDPTAQLRREFNEAVKLAKQVFSGADLEEQLIALKEAFMEDAASRIKDEKERKARTRELPDSNLRSADTQDRLLRAQLGRTKTETEQLNQTRKTNDLLRALIHEIETSTPSVASFSGI